MKIRGFTIRIKMKSGKHKCEDLILGMQGVAGAAVGFSSPPSKLFNLN